VREQRFASACLFGAACPARSAGVALVLPNADTAAMNLMLAELACALPAGTHAVLVLDRAGWHLSADLRVPVNLTLVHLPPHAPELTGREGLAALARPLAQPPRAAGLCRRPHAACGAWNGPRAEPGRLRSLTSFPWLPSSVATS
jgi:hypothetical protein